MVRPVSDISEGVSRSSLFTRWLWVLGLALYLAVVTYVGWRRLGETLLSVHWPNLAMTAAVYIAALWLRAAKWRLVLGGKRQAVGLFFVSKAGGGLSPGRVGELAPLLLPGHRDAGLAAWIILDRLLEGGATILLGLAGLLSLNAATAQMAWLFGGALLCLVVLPMILLRHRTFFARAAAWVRRPLPLHRVLCLFETVSREMMGLDRVLPWTAALTLIATSMDIVVAKELYRCFGYDVPYALLATTQCAHGLTSIMPFTPNATGVPYLVAGGIVHAWAGVPVATIAAVIGLNTPLAAVLFWSSFGMGASGLRFHRRTE